MSDRIAMGRPTELQAKPLVERFKQLADGDQITWVEIAKIIGERYRCHRFNTVCESARKTLLNETGVVLKALNGLGLRRPTGDEQIRHGVLWVKHGSKKIRRGNTIVTVIADDRLTTKGRMEQMNVMVHMAAMQNALAREQKNMRQAFTETVPIAMLAKAVEPKE